jgi:hypothetical protein
MPLGKLTSGLPLELEEGRSWTSFIASVCDDIPELHAKNHMAIMLENGVVFTVERNAKWTAGAKIEVRTVKVRRPGISVPHPFLYPILIA